MSLILPPGLQLGVHDDVSIRVDCAVTVVRRYTFTNGTQSAIDFQWKGRERLPAAAREVVVQLPGVAIGTSGDSAPVLEWDVPLSIVEPEGALSVNITFDCADLVQLNPLRLALKYQSALVCSYSLAVRSPFGGLVLPNDCVLEGTQIGGILELILGHDGVLRTEHPARLSARTGSCSIKIEKVLPPAPKIPLLQYFSSRGGVDPKPLNGHVVLLIPHLLRDSLAYMQSLCSAGMRPDHTFVIGIPYSTKREVGQVLWQWGLRHIELPEDYPFNDTVRQLLEQALRLCREVGLPLLIVEDGGYAGPLLHTEFASDISNCRGIVEQTRNGIWQYRDQKIDPKVPIFNVAESELKLRRESPLIGDAIVFNVRTLIAHFGKALQRYRTLVVGYGSTGSHVAKALREASVDTVVFDQREDRKRVASDDGFPSKGSLAELLADRQLIIGCTGEVPFQFNEILAIQHQAIFVNASSKRREINYQELDALTDQDVPERAIPGVGHVRRLVNGRELALLANGYPVNFVGESVPDHEIAFILALLQQSAVRLVQEAGRLPAGILDVPEELQKEIESCHDGFLKQ